MHRSLSYEVFFKFSKCIFCALPRSTPDPLTRYAFNWLDAQNNDPQLVQQQQQQQHVTDSPTALADDHTTMLLMKHVT